jgi:hypothetical protein
LVEDYEPVFGGGSRKVMKGVPDGPQIKLTGPARPMGMDPDAKRVIGGYGLTFNVPRDEFERWLEDNKHTDVVKNRHVFCHENVDHVEGQARELKLVRSGLEPLNTESRDASGKYKDPRMPNKMRKFNPDDDTVDIRGKA